MQTPLSASKNVLCYESHILEIMYNYAVEASAADIDGSGTVDSIDYTLVNRYLQGTYYFPPY